MTTPDTRRVQLAELFLEPSVQPRLQGLDPTHVQSLAEAPESWTELVAVDMDGRLVLVDGAHRYEAARQIGLDAVSVRVVPMPVDGDLRGLAFAFNAQHGKALTHADRRNEAQRLLRTRPDLADREIARRCGLAPNTVGNLRDQLECAGEVATTETRIGADGRVRTVSSREPGELPLTDLGEDVANFADLVLGKSERRQQRRIASYLRRLAVSLDDQHRLSGWKNAHDAVEALRAAVPTDELMGLSERLGNGARRVIEVAALLERGGPS